MTRILRELSVFVVWPLGGGSWVLHFGHLVDLGAFMMDVPHE